MVCVQVTGSARIRGKAASEALSENLRGFAEEVNAGALCVGMKPPKKPKKILTAEQECDKAVVAQFKRPEPQPPWLTICFALCATYS